MSTTADLPITAHQLNNSAGNGPMSYHEDASGREMTAAWVVPWADQTAFRNVVVGTTTTYTSGGNTYTRKVPLQCPFDPGLYAAGLSGKYCGADGSVSPSKPFTHVLFTVTFGLLPFGANSETPYQSLQESGGSRSITIPTARYTFGNGEVLDHGVAVTHSGVSFVFTQFQMSPSQLANFRSQALSLLATPVNSGPLTIAGQTFPAGTVLFETYQVDQVDILFGETKATVSAVLNYSALPWNKLIRSDGVVDTVTPALYDTGNLSGLIN